MNKKTLALGVTLFFLTVLFSGCIGPYGLGKPDIKIHELENEIHNLVNEERINQGLPSLKYDTDLSNIARLHSMDMVENDFFSHNNLRGQDPTARAKSYGYDCYKNFGGYYRDGVAENIFQNNQYTETGSGVCLIPYWYTYWSSMEDIAQSTVQGWMNSYGHRQNILDPSYDKEGIGVAISSDDKVYITQNFW